MKSRFEGSQISQAPRVWLTGRKLLGMVIIAAGSLLLMDSLHTQWQVASAQMRAALLGSTTAAIATALGTLPVLLAQRFSKRAYDCCLGFGGGVMLGATMFSLIVPALAASRAAGNSGWNASLMVGGGILAGAFLINLLNRFVHTGAASDEHNGGAVARAWIFVSAVALHNIPEGLAIGVAYAGPDIAKAHALATGISIQDVPEGLVVALALRGIGYGRCAAAGLGALSGLVEPLAAIFGVALIGLSASMLPFGLAAAAGAMLYVIVREVIPESQAGGNANLSSPALMVGFVLMTVLDTALA